MLFAKACLCSASDIAFCMFMCENADPLDIWIFCNLDSYVCSHNYALSIKTLIHKVIDLK